MADTDDASALDLLRRQLLRLNPALADSAIDPDAPLLDEGYLDSLTASELLAYVEDTFGVDLVPDRLLGDLSSLRLLAAAVDRLKAAPA